MLSSPVIHAVCILVKDYYDVDKIEKIKAEIAKMSYFRFFISSQYREEPKYDIYVVSSNPVRMVVDIRASPSIMDHVQEISVNSI